MKLDLVYWLNLPREKSADLRLYRSDDEGYLEYNADKTNFI